MPSEKQNREPVLFAWSGGKDSALALYEAVRENNYAITLLTTITGDYKRVSMHGVREELLDLQTKSLNLPVEKVYIPKKCSEDEYELIMERIMSRYKQKGYNKVLFGDIFLQGIREYRENNLAKTGMQALFPLWNKSTVELGQAFIQKKFKAIVTCIDSEALDKSFTGRLYDTGFIADLPEKVDPCGENGEFHTFVFAGPLFKNPVKFLKGDIVLRENRFYFCDLLV